MKRGSLYALVAIGLISTLAGAARANDDKTFGPSLCRPLLNGDIYGNPSYVVSPNAFMLPNGTSLGVVCPIVRDNTTNTGGISSAAIWVNNQAGQVTSCSFYSVGQKGETITWASKERTAEGTGAITFNNANIPRSQAKGTYSFYCGLPSGGAIYSYFVSEY
jgi:hypothetical protein